MYRVCHPAGLTFTSGVEDEGRNDFTMNEELKDRISRIAAGIEEMRGYL